MTPEVKAAVLETLNNSKVAVLSIIDHVDKEQFVSQPKNGWSISELVEHIMIVDKSILKAIQKLGKTPSTELIEGKLKLPQLMKITGNRETKVKAPERLRPKGIFKTKQAAIAAFNTHHIELNSFVRTTQLNLKTIGFPHLLIGMMNGEQWLFFMAGHCDRHVDQMKEQLGIT